MTIDIKLGLISYEIQCREDSLSRMKSYRDELSELSPFEIGKEYEGNDWSYKGKVFVCESIGVSYNSSTVYFDKPDSVPRYFFAKGRIKLKSGKLGVNETRRFEPIKP